MVKGKWPLVPQTSDLLIAGADNFSIKTILKKMFNRHKEEFLKFQVNIKNLTDRLLA